MTVQEILQKTLDRYTADPRTWIRGDYASTEYTDQGAPIECHCLVGGLTYTVTGDTDETVPTDFRCEQSPELAHALIVTEAAIWGGPLLDETDWGVAETRIIDWNDQERRTLAEVQVGLGMAIARAAKEGL